MIIKYENYINESYSRAPLYHALDTKYAVTALDNNKLDAYTFQRFWEDGRRYKDDHPNYKNSFYYRGLSLTRDINYAKKFNTIIFEFDQEKLKQKYTLIPYNWGFSIGRGYEQKERVKKEREEFLIVSKLRKVMDNSELAKMIQTPGGSITNLDKYITGIYISKTSYDIYTENDTEIYEPFGKIKNHPKYKGVI